MKHKLRKVYTLKIGSMRLVKTCHCFPLLGAMFCCILCVTLARCFEECFGDIKFIFVAEEVSFNDAVADCVQRGATLARISNRAEFDFAREFMDGSTLTESGAWIGKQSLDSSPLGMINSIRLSDNGVSDGNNTSRLSFVEGSNEGRNFFTQAKVFPWADRDGDDCILYFYQLG